MNKAGSKIRGDRPVGRSAISDLMVNSGDLGNNCNY